MSKIAADVLAAEDTDGLSSPQRRALSVLLRGGGDDAAGRSAGVSARTVRRWRATSPGFGVELAVGERLALADAGRTLGRLCLTAAETSGRVLTSKTATDATRLKAADLILRSAIAFRTFVDLEDRIAELEQAVGEKGDRYG